MVRDADHGPSRWRRRCSAPSSLGLGYSITLAQVVLGLLALCWLARVREPGRWQSLRFPLLAPGVALAGVTVLAALASARPAASLLASKNLLLFAALYLVLHALDGPARAYRFLTFLSLTLASVSIFGILQVSLCPSDPGWIPLASRFFKRCDRAHAFYSIYMTLAGVLSLGPSRAPAPRLARQPGPTLVGRPHLRGRGGRAGAHLCAGRVGRCRGRRARARGHGPQGLAGYCSRCCWVAWSFSSWRPRDCGSARRASSIRPTRPCASDCSSGAARSGWCTIIPSWAWGLAGSAMSIRATRIPRPSA